MSRTETRSTPSVAKRGSAAARSFSRESRVAAGMGAALWAVPGILPRFDLEEAILIAVPRRRQSLEKLDQATFPGQIRFPDASEAFYTVDVSGMHDGRSTST